MRRPLAALAVALLLAGPGLVACGSGDTGESADGIGSESAAEREAGHEGEEGLESAADRSVCRADAQAVDTPYGGSFPDGFPFPPDTTVYDVEEREGSGTIVTAISSAPFADILDFLNHDAVDAGFAVTEGETEEHDAEATWEHDGQRGRWAIRESGSCEGETVVQVLAGEPS